MKKFLSILFAAVALLSFAACEQSDGDVDAPKPVLTLTAAEVEVAADAVAGEVAYTLKNEKEGAEFTFEYEAEWLSAFAAAEGKVTFTVAANDGDAREAKVTVKYDVATAEFTVKQAAKAAGGEDAPVLTLAVAEVEVAADAVAGEVAYTLENEKEGAEFTFEYEAEWLSAFAAAEGKVTFTVAANDGDAREAKVTVKYDVATAEFTVKQAAKAAEEVKYDYEYNVFYAFRATSEDLGVELGANDFYLALANDWVDCAVALIAESDILTPGTYTSAEGSVDLENTMLYDYENDVEIIFTDAVVVVDVYEDESGYILDMVLTDEAGKKYHITCGDIPVDELLPVEDKDPVDFNPVKVVAEHEYNGEKYDAGNFALLFYVDEEHNHVVDMRDKENPNDNHLSAGLYSIENGGIDPQYSSIDPVLPSGETYTLKDAELELTINADNTVTIVGYLKSSDGDHLNIDWTGTVEGFTFPSEGGDEPVGELGSETNPIVLTFDANPGSSYFWGSGYTLMFYSDSPSYTITLERCDGDNFFEGVSVSTDSKWDLSLSTVYGPGGLMDYTSFEVKSIKNADGSYTFEYLKVLVGDKTIWFTVPKFVLPA